MLQLIFDVAWWCVLAYLMVGLALLVTQLAVTWWVCLRMRNTKYLLTLDEMLIVWLAWPLIVTGVDG